MNWKPGNRVLVWDKTRLGRVRRVEGSLVLVEITADAYPREDPPAGYAAWWPAGELCKAGDGDPEKTDPRGSKRTEPPPEWAQQPVPDVPTSRLRKSRDREGT